VQTIELVCLAVNELVEARVRELRASPEVR